MFSTNLPTPYTLGQELSFKLTFLTDAELPAKYFGGKAVIVRLEVDEDRMMANLGLKFKELSFEAQRALPKILQYYMLEEQRNRKEEYERRLNPPQRTASDLDEF
jgi:c-di-GMP-binding flagellar brake protein YcgR